MPPVPDTWDDPGYATQREKALLAVLLDELVDDGRWFELFGSDVDVSVVFGAVGECREKSRAVGWIAATRAVADFYGFRVRSLRSVLGMLGARVSKAILSDGKVGRAWSVP
jgi:hypothetical protein